MRVLFLFLDGVGLGPDDPTTNPFARASMPYLESLLGGRQLTSGTAPVEAERATLLPLDANMGVKGLPQSATGQAALLTGRNVAADLGYHYGPKPNPPVAAYLQNGNLFHKVREMGLTPDLLTAYPPGYFAGVNSGRRMYSAIPLAATSAGLSLKTASELEQGLALSADLTGQGWIDHLGLPDTPLLEPFEAGQRLSQLSAHSDFSLFEYWLTDYAGHKQDWPAALRLVETLDQVLGGLAASWEDHKGLIVVTSDHGNMEDLSTRRHTSNPVPALLIGALNSRRKFAENLTSLVDVHAAIIRMLSQ